MSVKISASISGSKELQDALMQLPKATSKSVMVRALKKAAAPTAALAADLAPRDTGDLSKSIQVTTQLSRRQKAALRSKTDEAVVYVGPTGKSGALAHLIEFGTAHSAAHPFMRVAWDRTKGTAASLIERELWAALLKSVRTLAKKAAKGTLSKAARRSLGG